MFNRIRAAASSYLFSRRARALLKDVETFERTDPSYRLYLAHEYRRILADRDRVLAIPAQDDRLAAIREHGMRAMAARKQAAEDGGRSALHPGWNVAAVEEGVFSVELGILCGHLALGHRDWIETALRLRCGPAADEMHAADRLRRAV
ncbi:hypothetical protein [Salinarimonas soli]|uniref:Uncharacterized protein n=1 Tax=Salinarimonas soli TaxID=1638099 RepID=A0A5B2W2D5_9HYPH|nr:hypothetical protein [Salinarimonas soli]KAA2244399.1 hypothetical protein F0L46_00430 [Salinarimonas soli]